MSAILESLNTFSAAGLAAILNTLWLAFAVAAVIWISLRLMPRVNAATRHAVWWAVLALVAISPLATLLPRPARPPARTEMQVQARTLSSPAAKPLPAMHASAPLHKSATLHPSGAAVPSAPALASASPHPLSSGALREPGIRIPIEFHAGNWQAMLLFLWIGLSSVLMARILLSYLHLRGLRNRARQASADIVLRFEQHLRESRTSRGAQLLVSEDVISPLVAGFLHPVIILPDLLLKEISEPELDYVLLHELAHVVRRDNWTNLMARLVSAAFVFHPVAAWVLHRIEREREIACDDWVVAATGSALRYAATLARMFEFCCSQRRELLATGMAHRTSNIRERIEMLLRPRLHFSPGASLSRVSFCIAAGLALVSFGLRMPGWVAFAKSSNAVVAHPPAQIFAARMAAKPEAAPIVPATYVATLSSANGAQSSAAPTSETDQDKTWRHEWKITRDGSNSSKVQLSLIVRDDDGNDRTNTQGVPLSSLSGFSLSMLDHDGPVKFEYVRDSGRILCEGTASGGRAAGPFTVALNPSFVSDLEKMGYAAPRENEAFALVTSDVTLSYARAIRDTGLTSSISDVVVLQDHGVGSDYVREVRQEGFTNLTAGEISDLRDHGVTPDYLKAIKAVGPNLSIEQIDSLYDHGVKPDSYKGLAAADSKLSIEEIDSLYDHGVEPESYKGFAAVDSKLSIEEINSLRDHGVKPEYYGRMKSIAPNLSIEQIDSLFDHGVKPDSYKGFAAADSKLSIEEIDSLYDHGVPPDSYKGFASVDPNLSIEEIDSLHDHGVEPDFYRGTKAADSKVSIEEIDRLRDHGVEPEYLTEIRALPDGFSISDVSELRDHGITANYIRNLHDMGIKTLTAAQVVRIHDKD